MNAEKQQIAIAEACGWRCIQNSNKYGLGINGYMPGYSGDLNNLAFRVIIPDYLSDLNAMHEAEKVMMTGSNRIEMYGRWLAQLANVVAPVSANYIAIVAHATTTLRAEAFLRTLNLWEE